MSTLRNLFCTAVPSIAQLVERRTVEEELISLGRWFESGSKEFYVLSLCTLLLLVIITVLIFEWFLLECRTKPNDHLNKPKSIQKQS